MKKLFLVLVAVFLFVAPAIAQAAHFVVWDPNAAADAVTFYTVVLDGTTGISVSSTPTAPCTADPAVSACIQWPLPTTIANGSHTVSVTATNMWGTSAPTTVTFNVTGPGTIKNIRIK